MPVLDKQIVALSAVNIDDARELYENFLLPKEEVKFSFLSLRDRLVITNKRIILIDPQGLSGKKKEFLFIRYKSILAFSIETAGTIDIDSELRIWIAGGGFSKFSFVKKTDIKEIGIFIGLQLEN